MPILNGGLMKAIRLSVLFLGTVLALVGCGTSGVPQPIKVLENPDTGERTRFFPEVAYKVPADYNAAPHIAQWTSEQEKAGFTREISPADDRVALAKLRKKNLSAARP